jgi:NTP pyrophosphatase (non-canonical NTP hydrolase)
MNPKMAELIAGHILQAYVDEATRTEPDYAQVISRLKDPRTVRLLHAAMGLVTESAKFLDMLKKHIFYGKPIDKANAVEEVGDALWYQRIACHELEVRFLKVLETNQAKLRKRFPEKFTSDKAINRDTDAERKILEQKVSE